MLSIKHKLINPKNLKLILIAINSSIIALLLLGSLLYFVFDISSRELIYPSCCCLLFIWIWGLFSWYLIQQDIFDPYIIFFTMATLFNGGNALLEIFNLNQGTIIFYDFSDEINLQTIFLVLIGLTSFHQGALISDFFEKKSENKLEINFDCDQEKEAKIEQGCRIVGFGLFGISIFPSFLVLKQSLTKVLNYGYHVGLGTLADTSTGVASSYQKLADFLIPSIFFILVGSKKKPHFQIFCLIFVLGYSAFRFFLGQRKQGLLSLIFFGWLWHTKIKKLPLLLILTVALLMLFVILPLVKATREVAGLDRLSLDFLIYSFSSLENNPLVELLSESGFTMATIAGTIEFVPSVRDFQLGADYFKAFLALIPNLFWDIHPAVKGAFNVWLVWKLDFGFAATGGGLGYSFIAEAYLNFGWIGAPIILAILGFIYIKIIVWGTKENNPAKLAMITSFLSFFVFYARSPFVNEIRNLVWYGIIPYFMVSQLVAFHSSKLSKAKPEKTPQKPDHKGKIP